MAVTNIPISKQGYKRLEEELARLKSERPAIIQAMGSQQEGASLTEADVKKLVRQEMEAYFAELAQKPVSPWAQAAVESVLARGLMRGDADGSFRPQSFITRQEVAAVLENLS